MTAVFNQPNLTEGLTLLGWRLKRDAEIRERRNEENFECEVEPTSTSYAAFEYMSTADDAYDPYAGLNVDLCLEVDAIDLNGSVQQQQQQVNDDYDPYEVFMRMNTRRTVTGRDRAPLAVLPSHSATSPGGLTNNYRHYNYAEDDTPVKYPLAIGLVDRRLKQQQNVRGGYTPRPSFEEERRPSNYPPSRGGGTSVPVRPVAPPSSYRQPPAMVPRRGISSSYSGSRGGGHHMRRNIPPPPRLYPRSEYPPSASSKRVTFRHSNDFNSGDDFDDEEDDDDSLEGDLHQPIMRRNKPPRRTAARIAVQRFRANNHRSSLADDDLDDDIAPTVTEMDMLEDQEADDDDETSIQPLTKSMSSPVKLPPPPPASKPSGGGSKSSYIGNMLPSFYEQLPESKKMLLQDATIDSSSSSPTVQTQSNITTTSDLSSKSQIEVTSSPGKKPGSLVTEHIEGPGGEEIIDEENRLQFRNTTTTQSYRRPATLQGTKRYYDHEDDDEQQEQAQSRKRVRGNDDDYASTGGRYSQYPKLQHRYRRYEEDEEYDLQQDAQQQEDEHQQSTRVPARRGRPPSQHYQHQEEPAKKYARLIAQFEEQHGLKLGDMRVFAPKLRLRISNVNVNWINLPPVPKFPNKVHES